MFPEHFPFDAIKKLGNAAEVWAIIQASPKAIDAIDKTYFINRESVNWSWKQNTDLRVMIRQTEDV